MRPTLKSLFFTAALVLSSSSYAGEVTRAMFTIGIDNREPVIMVDSIDSSSSYTSISFFTELNGLSGHNVTHQWTHNDKVMFEKTFEVKGGALARLDQQDPDPGLDRFLDCKRT